MDFYSSHREFYIASGHSEGKFANASGILEKFWRIDSSLGIEYWVMSDEKWQT